MEGAQVLGEAEHCGKNFNSGVFCLSSSGWRSPGYPPERKCFQASSLHTGLFLKLRHWVTLSNRCQPPEKKTLEKEVPFTRSPPPATADANSRAPRCMVVSSFTPILSCKPFPLKQVELAPFTEPETEAQGSKLPRCSEAIAPPPPLTSEVTPFLGSSPDHLPLIPDTIWSSAVFPQHGPPPHASLCASTQHFKRENPEAAGLGLRLQAEPWGPPAAGHPAAAYLWAMTREAHIPPKQKSAETESFYF